MMVFSFPEKTDKGTQLTSEKCYCYNRSCFHHEGKKAFINRFKGSFLKQIQSDASLVDINTQTLHERLLHFLSVIQYQPRATRVSLAL